MMVPVGEDYTFVVCALRDGEALTIGKVRTDIKANTVKSEPIELKRFAIDGEPTVVIEDEQVIALNLCLKSPVSLDDDYFYIEAVTVWFYREGDHGSIWFRSWLGAEMAIMVPANEPTSFMIERKTELPIQSGTYTCSRIEFDIYIMGYFKFTMLCANEDNSPLVRLSL